MDKSNLIVAVAKNVLEGLYNVWHGDKTTAIKIMYTVLWLAIWPVTIITTYVTYKYLVWRDNKYKKSIWYKIKKRRQENGY